MKKEKEKERAFKRKRIFRVGAVGNCFPFCLHGKERQKEKKKKFLEETSGGVVKCQIRKEVSFP